MSSRRSFQPQPFCDSMKFNFFTEVFMSLQESGGMEFILLLHKLTSHLKSQGDP